MIELSPEHEKFVEEQVADGRFEHSDQVVHAAIEFFRQRLRADYEETVRIIKQGMDDFDNGKTQPLSEACDEIRQELGLGE